METLEKFVKWSTLSLISFIIFLLLKEERTTEAIGGEVLIFFLPFIWCLCEKTFKDIIQAIGEYHQ